MIDGLDGVGKTTQIELLAKKYTDAGQAVKTSRINGGTDIGEQLRSVMLGGNPRPANTDLFIAMAMYSALAAQVEQWRLGEKNGLILIDRSPLSLIAYQVYGEQASPELAQQFLDLTLQMFNPSGIIVYDLDAQQALARNKGMPSYVQDYYTSHSPDFFKDVRSGFLDSAKKLSPLVNILDVTGLSPEQVCAKTSQIIDAI